MHLHLNLLDQRISRLLVLLVRTLEILLNRLLDVICLFGEFLGLRSIVSDKDVVDCLVSFTLPSYFKGCCKLTENILSHGPQLNPNPTNLCKVGRGLVFKELRVGDLGGCPDTLVFWVRDLGDGPLALFCQLPYVDLCHVVNSSPCSRDSGSWGRSKVHSR